MLHSPNTVLNIKEKQLKFPFGRNSEHRILLPRGFGEPEKIRFFHSMSNRSRNKPSMSIILGTESWPPGFYFLYSILQTSPFPPKSQRTTTIVSQLKACKARTIISARLT